MREGVRVRDPSGLGFCRRCVALTLAALAVSTLGLGLTVRTSSRLFEIVWTGLIVASGVMLALHLLGSRPRRLAPR